MATPGDVEVAMPAAPAENLTAAAYKFNASARPATSGIGGAPSRIPFALAIVAIVWCLALTIALGIVGTGALQTSNTVGLFSVGLSSDVAAPGGYTGKGSLYAGTGFWAVRVPMPWGRSDFPCAALSSADGLVYLFGGATGGVNGSSTVTSTVTVHDTVLHTYTSLAPMAAKRARMQTIPVINYTVYLVGGFSDDAMAMLSNTVERYNVGLALANGLDPAISSSLTIKLNTPRSDHCAVAVGTKIYVIGGYDTNYNVLASVEVMDTAAWGSAVGPVWTQLTSMPAARGDLMCTVANGLIYVAGGYFGNFIWGGSGSTGASVGSGFQTGAYVFNPATNAWTTLANMPYPHSDGYLVTIDSNRLMVVGGEQTNGLATRAGIPSNYVSRYYIDKNAWVSKALVPTARFRNCAAYTNNMVATYGGQEAASNSDLANFLLPASYYLNNVEGFFDLSRPEIWVDQRN